MNILVTGASGIVGRQLVTQLQEKGHTVTGLCRKPPLQEKNGICYLRGDVSRPQLGLGESEWSRLCRETEVIFHLAAKTDFKGKSLEDYRPVNIEGVRNIKEFAIASGAWLHHVSTAFVCGKWPGRFHEEQLQEKQPFHNYYEESKCIGEQILRTHPISHYTIYRPAIILERTPTTARTSLFGPLVFLEAVFRLCLKSRKKNMEFTTLRVAGDGQAHLPFVFDDDVATCLIALALTSPKPETTFHLTPVSPFANEALEQIFNQAFSQKAVAWTDEGALNKEPLSISETLLANKTKMYKPYLFLTTQFSRKNLENALGPDVLPAVSEEALLHSFSHFLASKKELRQVISNDEQFQIDTYFTQFLPRYLEKPLLKNLTSLSVCFHVTIGSYSTWRIRIVNGVLKAVEQDILGDFGYTTDSKSFLAIASARLSPQRGFFQGSIHLEKNPKEALRTATALEEFFQQYPYALSTLPQEVDNA